MCLNIGLVAAVVKERYDFNFLRGELIFSQDNCQSEINDCIQKPFQPLGRYAALSMKEANVKENYSKMILQCNSKMVVDHRNNRLPQTYRQ